MGWAISLKGDGVIEHRVIVQNIVPCEMAPYIRVMGPMTGDDRHVGLHIASLPTSLCKPWRRPWWHCDVKHVYACCGAKEKKLFYVFFMRTCRFVNSSQKYFIFVKTVSLKAH
jgi:hypothetical protein